MDTSCRTFDDTLFPILEIVSNGIVLVDQDGRIIYVNREVVGWRGGASCVENVAEIFDELSQTALANALRQVVTARTEPVRFEGRIRASNGSTRPVTISLVRLELATGSLIGLVAHPAQALATDAALRRRDPLTGLLDRAFLMERLETLLSGERSADRAFALLFIDLDNFKQVNDDFGHLIGDQILREAASRLSRCLREGDDVVRFGGDEFVVLLQRVAGREEIDPVIHRIRDALAQPITVAQHDVALSLSIGVAQASPEHRTPEDVLNDADRAMYAAKRVL
jgi:diguanylate cyclase (GGDEF)-like protein/PAS domain S-box-containing protein